MVDEIHGSGPNKPNKAHFRDVLSQTEKHYKPRYYLNKEVFPVWEKFWKKLNFSTELTHDDICKMTDTFIDFISREMGNVLSHALKVQKANDRAILTGESPEPV